MKNIITVLKRKNGMFGIYLNGNKQDNLINNSPLNMSVEYLIDLLILKSKDLNNVEIVFSDNEENFKSNLPTLQEFIIG